MRMRAALDPPAQHPGHLHVGAEIRPPGNFIDPVGRIGRAATTFNSSFSEVDAMAGLSFLYPNEYSDHETISGGAHHRRGRLLK